MLNEEILSKIEEIIENNDLEPFNVVLSYSSFHFDNETEEDYYTIEDIKISYEDLVNILNDGNLASYICFRHKDNLLNNKTSDKVQFFKWFDGVIYCFNGLITIKRIYNNGEYVFSSIEYYQYEDKAGNTYSYNQLKRFIVEMADNIDFEADHFNPSSKDEEPLTIRNLFKRPKKDDKDDTEYTLTDPDDDLDENKVEIVNGVVNSSHNKMDTTKNNKNKLIHKFNFKDILKSKKN